MVNRDTNTHEMEQKQEKEEDGGDGTLWRKSIEKVKKAEEMAYSVVSEAAQVRAFKGRWIVISNRASQAITTLQAVNSVLLEQGSHHTCARGGEEEAEKLLDRTLFTLQEGLNLATPCVNLSFEGKLLMQSNLDSIAAKLELCLRDLCLLLDSGMLREEKLPVSDLELFARLKISDPGIKKSALDLLLARLRQNGARISDISALLQLLDADMSMNLREKAAEAVAILAESEPNRRILAVENAHVPLIRLLISGSPAAKEIAATAIQSLTSSNIPENAHAVASHEGIPALVELCRSGTPRAQTMAASALRNLAAVEPLRQILVEEGAITALLELLTSSCVVSTQEKSAEALHNFASSAKKDDNLRQIIAENGGVQSLLQFLCQATTPTSQEIAIRTLQNLATSAQIARSLVSAGYLNQLAAILKDKSSTSVQQLAASAICHLSASLNVRKALSTMLEAKQNTSEQEIAAQNLSSLLIRKELIIKEEKSMSRLVQMIDPRNHRSIAKRFPISALFALSGGNSHCRKRITSVGATRQHLEKLAEMEVARAATKTLDKIGGRKIFGIFSRLRSSS